MITKDNNFTAVWNKLIDNTDNKTLYKLSNLFALEFNEGKTKHSNDDLEALLVLHKAAEMTLISSSINEPLVSKIQLPDYYSFNPNDFSQRDLDVLEKIVNTISFSPLVARINDLLWILGKPRKPIFATNAIEAYIDFDLDKSAWHTEQKPSFERAIKLCRQIKDVDKLSDIEILIFSAFQKASNDDDVFCEMLGKFIEVQRLLSSKKPQVFETLKKLGIKNIERSQYKEAIGKFNICLNIYSAKDYIKDRSDLNSLIGDSLVCLGDEYLIADSDQSLFAKSQFEQAITVYQKVPTELRDRHSIKAKLTTTRKKITEAGLISIENMDVIKTEIENAEEGVNQARALVSNKPTIVEALVCFSLLCRSPSVEQLIKDEKENLKNGFLTSFIASKKLSENGRTIAKSPELNFDKSGEMDDQFYLNKASEFFEHRMNYCVQIFILPALEVIIKEHYIDKTFVYNMCVHSPIVPVQNRSTVCEAIWLGIEYMFPAAIYLIAPMVENLIRERMKKEGVSTTVIDINHIENEIGLSALLEREEASMIFGQDLLFELKSVFTNPHCTNLRNEVAHGLLSDSKSLSVGPVYAWYLLLRLVINSLVNLSEKNDFKETS
ncbi:DUF4209 domain-containing protein [Aliiglaciecola aliphaticivorans]